MNRQALGELAVGLAVLFDEVLLLNADLTQQTRFDTQGGMAHLAPCDGQTFSEERRCTLLRALHLRCRVCGVEWLGGAMVFRTAQAVEVEGIACLLEGSIRLLCDENLSDAAGCGMDDVATALCRRLYVDALTGAYNRLYFEERVRKCASACGDVRGVAMLDIDRFKTINDTYGHLAGDRVLGAVVQMMQRCVRETDSIIRYGGDEFLLVFETLPCRVFARRLEHIRCNAQEIALSDYPGLRLSVSLGGVCGTGSLDALIACADEHLYEAKKERNRVVVGEI